MLNGGLGMVRTKNNMPEEWWRQRRARVVRFEFAGLRPWMWFASPFLPFVSTWESAHLRWEGRAELIPLATCCSLPLHAMCSVSLLSELSFVGASYIDILTPLYVTASTSVSLSCVVVLRGPASRPTPHGAT